ncbi:MAG: 4-hydroxy-tetrahydrodipicolinate synthase [Deltaproteobacteria bacterium]|nr:4-hydroxy-tetrahydrodipicolinate synthase [Deltaproteobacteria bacterium]
MTLFQGSMTAIVTPFKKGMIDEPALRRLVDFQIKNGTDVIVPCGTTGESSTLSHAEHQRVVAIVVEHVNKRVKVLAGAGSNSTAHAVELHKYCDRAGVDGTLQITPYYNKPSAEGLYQHFKTIAAAADLPIILYNVPGRTSVNMLPETVVRLSHIDTIVGVKEASGNLVQASEIINQTDESFALLSGEDALNYPLLCLGAKGTISVTANVVPGECSKQYQAVQKGDYKTAASLHNRLLPLHKMMFVDTNPIPVKAALHLMGHIEEEYRLPLVVLDATKREKLRLCLKEFGLTS